MFMLNETDRARLAREANVWLATVRANQTPHLVPVWFVWLDDKAYICTGKNSVKARNIAANPRVVLALEQGNDPVVIEGDARILDKVPNAVAENFLQKYEWNINTDRTYDAVIEITPRRVVL